MAVGPAKTMPGQGDLPKRLGWTFLILCCYRIGVHVPIPGVDASALASFFESMSGTLFNLFDMFSGGGLSNVSNMTPKHIRPILDSTTVAMAMYCGLTSAIVNPCDQRLMETIKSADIIKNNTLYAKSFV